MSPAFSSAKQQTIAPFAFVTKQNNSEFIGVIPIPLSGAVVQDLLLPS